MKHLVVLALILAGSCNASGAPPSPTPAPTGSPTAGPPAPPGAPQDAMACQLVEQPSGVLGLTCDVQGRFAPYLGQALQGGLQGCRAAAPGPGDLVAQFDCAVADPYAAPLRAAIDRGPLGRLPAAR